MFLKEKKLHLVILIILISTAAFFRFWQIRDYAEFLGDQGRDMIVMREMFLEKRPVFLGPTASVGGFYLGPIYYWMAAPFLALSMFDPIGPSFMVAAFGVATVLLLYKFLKETSGFYPAVLIAFLYAVAPLIVRYSRSSWNPNPLPFFSLLLMYFVYLAAVRKKLTYFVFAGASFGIAIQLHYLAAALLIVVPLIVALNFNFRKWLPAFGLSALGFLITFSPFLIFEIYHKFPNFKTIFEFATRGTTAGYKSPNLIWVISNTGNILLEEISKLRGTLFTKLFFWTIIALGLFGLVKNKKDKNKKLIFSIGLTWFLVGLAALRFYSGQIHDYYFGFMFPAPFLLTGIIVGQFWNKKLGKIVSVTFTAAALSWFLSQNIFKTSPNKIINQTETVSDFIVQKSEGKPFNFALISGSNSDHAYRYFLEIKGAKPVDLETLVTEQLLIVCESKDCRPLGHPTWEIAGFGRGEIEGQWELEKYGIKIFKLRHWPGAPSPAGKPAQKAS